jgi:thiol-disulfide isomerase/thioredoxin
MKFIRLHSNSNVDDLHRILKTEPCFVKFFAPWCGYCKMMKNDWDALEHVTPKNINVTILDVENTMVEHLPPQIREHVRGYPTIMKIDKGGNEQNIFSGNRTTGDMLNFIKQNFSRVHNLPKSHAKKKTKHAKKKTKHAKKKTKHAKKKTKHAKKKTKQTRKYKIKNRMPTPYPN